MQRDAVGVRAVRKSLPTRRNSRNVFRQQRGTTIIYRTRHRGASRRDKRGRAAFCKCYKVIRLR